MESFFLGKHDLIRSHWWLVAIANKREAVLPWLPHRLLLISAIIILTCYASFWVQQNLDIRDYLIEKMKPFEVERGIREEGEKVKEVGRVSQEMLTVMVINVELDNRLVHLMAL